MRLLRRFIVFAFLLFETFAFKEYLLKTCGESGFCNRNRHYANNIKNSKNIYYNLDPKSINYDSKLNLLTASVIKTIPGQEFEVFEDDEQTSFQTTKTDDKFIELPITINFLKDIGVRFTLNEKRDISLDNINIDYLNYNRYNETSNWAFDSKILSDNDINLSFTHTFDKKKNNLKIIPNNDKSIEIVIHLKDSFTIDVYYNSQLALTINDKLLLNIEHFRSEEENQLNLVPEESSFGSFEDVFQYSKDDTLPIGPESVALDVTIHGSNDVYGLPEHADSLRLKDTSDTEPYRLYNVDVFEYTLMSKMPMYGAIPLMISNHDNKFWSGIFWNNPADTWIDIKYGNKETSTHWISEAGIIDIVLMFSDMPNQITKKFTTLTGNPTLPLLSSIGYHQCRWNYNDEIDVLTVNAEMDRNQIPYDFIWLDLEYTDDRKYFTWKPNSFSNPKRLLKNLQKFGRQLVVLIDPHIKDGYEISDKLRENDVAVKDHNNNPYTGICWPGKSLWIDSFSKIGSSIWNSFFKKFLYKSVNNLFIWNDMNEPSVFDGPETSAPKDVLYDGGFEGRSVHNVYGMTLHESTYDSLKEFYSEYDKRPFVLTRAFYAGSQRTSAVWTGDNVATWDYLKVSIPMVLSNNIVGYPFIGADIAGFSGDPEEELVVRWYQAGVWYPFFRAHAHIDSKRREPYLFKEPIKSIIRDVIQLRYKLLPTLYTLFQESSIDGSPIMSPMIFNKPQYKEFVDVDDQFYMGNSGILVKPVTEKGIENIDMLFAPGVYYNFYTLESFVIKGDKIESKSIVAPFNKLPFFIEGGNILTLRENMRRSSILMHNDPYTLLVAPDKNGNANGSIYIDDGVTFAYEKGTYLKSSFKLIDGNKMVGEVDHLCEDIKSLGNVEIREIKIANTELKKKFKDYLVVKQDGEEYKVKVDVEDDKYVRIMNPRIKLNNKWEILF